MSEGSSVLGMNTPVRPGTTLASRSAPVMRDESGLVRTKIPRVELRERRCRVSRLEAGLGRQVLGRIGLATTIDAVVDHPGRLLAHRVGGIELDQRLGQRESNALVLADRSPENHALFGVLGCTPHRGAANA